MRGKRRTVGRKLACLLAGSVVAIGFVAAKPSVAGAVVSNACSGTAITPGILSGTYTGPVTVSGECIVNDLNVLAPDGLTVEPNSTLVAIYAPSDTPVNLTVDGNLVVDPGGTLIMGCNITSQLCVEGAGVSDDVVNGNLIASSPLDVVVHSSLITGNVSENRGGGGSAGIACAPINAFGPAYSAFEDNEIDGSLSITNLITCYIGVQRNDIGFFPFSFGILTFSGNHTGDPNGNEVGENFVAGALRCKTNIPAVHLGSDAVKNVYFFLDGPAVGQCASPISVAGI